MGYHSARRKVEILPFLTRGMDLETIMLSEIGRTEKVKTHIMSIICGI